MAEDVANDIVYYLFVDKVNETHLGSIRHWSHLKIAFDDGRIWVKGLDYAQVNSIEVKSIPYKTVFYEKEGKLFLVNSLLPDRKVPSFLWTSVDRALPVKLPGFNHNYFGLSEKVSVQVVPSGKEAQAVAMLTSLHVLEAYLLSAPLVRLQNITWVILNKDKIFLYGVPILPLTGNTFWQRKNMFFPTGYDLDLYILSDSVYEIIDTWQENFVIWNTDSTYFLIDRKDLKPLSLSSYRLSIRKLLSPSIHGA